MLRDLPELIYPLDLARARRALRGRVTLAGMQRLQPLLPEQGVCHARVDLLFTLDDLGHFVIRGMVWADLNLICQRCLKTVPFRAESKVRLNIISEQAQEDSPVGRDSEVIMAVEGQAVALSDIVEDELLLALPIAPAHPEGVCDISEKYSSAGLPADRREGPFAVLAGKLGPA